ncbi:MAG: hypothetical protein MI922_15945, partial [Bacteroidales bacterium]|nr:hypothetical protein [Bacteroidales bacterium]
MTTQDSNIQFLVHSQSISKFNNLDNSFNTKKKYSFGNSTIVLNSNLQHYNFVDGIDFYSKGKLLNVNQNTFANNELAELYQEYGEQFVEYISGNFFLVVVDSREKNIFFYSDRLKSKKFF